MTDHFDAVYLRWQACEEHVSVLRGHLNSLPLGETEDVADLARLEEHAAQSRALRAQLADLVIARQQCRAGAPTRASATL